MLYTPIEDNTDVVNILMIVQMLTGKKSFGLGKASVKCRLLVRYENAPSILLVTIINKSSSDKRC